MKSRKSKSQAKVLSDISSLVISMKGLLLLAERYQSSKEIQRQVVLVSKCLAQIDLIVSKAMRDSAD